MAKEGEQYIFIQGIESFKALDQKYLLSDCNRKIKWVSTDRFWAPDPRLYFYIF